MKTFSLVMISLLLAACGGSGNNKTASQPEVQSPAKTPEEIAATIEQAEKMAVEDVGSLAGKVTLPDVPLIDTSTVTGTDSNNNGVRDENEITIYKILNLIDSTDADSYGALLNIVSMMQPEIPVVAESIDERKIYCAYEALPEDIKNEFSLDSLGSMVLNTEERKNAFYQSLKQSSVSLGEERCD